MADLELKRMPGGRRLYTVDGVGTLRLKGLFSRSATAEAGGDTWRFARRGFFHRLVEATQAGGTAAGQFEPNAVRRGGTLCWDRRELQLRPVGGWRERYGLADGDRQLAVLEAKSWGRRPAKISVDDADSVEPGLLLFAAFVVRGLAKTPRPPPDPEERRWRRTDDALNRAAPSAPPAKPDEGEPRAVRFEITCDLLLAPLAPATSARTPPLRVRRQARSRPARVLRRSHRRALVATTDNGG